MKQENYNETVNFKTQYKRKKAIQAIKNLNHYKKINQILTKILFNHPLSEWNPISQLLFDCQP